jgi:hypothetical protein
MDYFLIEDAHLQTLKRISSRLHSEERLDGDEMRNLGHQLEAIERVCRQMQIVEARGQRIEIINKRGE